MFSTGLLLKLKPGCEQEYKQRHDELWPELAAAMHEAGVNMVIYLHENLLFIFATATSQQSWDDLDRRPVTHRWDKYMSDILEDGENGKTFIKTLPNMFTFGEFV